jgi:serine-type D-Ala-D-Ala carboxypeptidase/endopeptidase (penicillin-binding protein 4)
MKYLRAILFLALASCTTTNIQKSIKTMEHTYNHHLGLLVYDPETKKEIISYNADKYFTPASNTKILTFYACLKVLGNTIPALYYQQTGDSLIFWGTGDPTLLNSLLPQNEVLQFLSAQEADLYFSDANFNDSHFGPGWAWDDYNYTFSSEKSALPIYGNNLIAIKSNDQSFLSLEPGYFKKYFWMADSAQNGSVDRMYNDNIFMYTPGKHKLKATRPFKSSGLLTAQLLSDTLKRPVRYIHKSIPTEHSTLNGIASDSIYKVMMQASDNFMAEQLLLTCAGVVSDTLQAHIAIKYMLENYLQNMPDKPIWKDGSGLSRYNLITPRSLIWLWGRVLEEKPKDKLFPMLATGSQSGTLKNYFRSSTPYIFGKTGTLSNNHNLSGFLITQSGKVFIFSFMNNNYPTSSAPIKMSMEQILWEIHLKY